VNAPIVGILGTLTVLPLAAQVYWPATPKTVGIVPARHRHAPAVIQRRLDGTVTGSPWSGYVATGAPGSVTDAKGSWIVPSVTCKSGSQSSVFWVGIDGYGNNTVEQIGTASDCADGIPNYYAWYEFYPQPELRLFTVKPGDPISAEVSYSGGMFTVTLTDERTGRQGGQSLAWPDAQRSTAECVAEHPSSVTHVIDPLAEFGTVLFGYDNTGVANTCYATVGAQAGPIGSLPGAFPLSMVNNGTPEAAPSRSPRTGRVSRSRGPRSALCLVSTGETVRLPRRPSCRPSMGTSTEQQRAAVNTTVARSSKLPRVEP
jgi:hypothetical protein